MQMQAQMGWRTDQWTKAELEKGGASTWDFVLDGLWLVRTEGGLFVVVGECRRPTEGSPGKAQGPSQA